MSAPVAIVSTASLIAGGLTRRNPMLRPVPARILELGFCLLLLPSLARAQYSFTLECAGGMGSPTRSFSDASTCQAELNKALSQLSSMGGGCSVAAGACAGSGGSSGAGSSGGYSGGSFEAAVQAQFMNAMTNVLQSAIQRALTGPTPAERAARERQRQMQLERQRQAEAERRRKFEEEKGRLLGEMKGEGGPPAAELQLKGLGPAETPAPEAPLQMKDLSEVATAPEAPPPSAADAAKLTEAIVRRIMEPDPKLEAGTRKVLHDFNESAVVIDLKDGWERGPSLAIPEVPAPAVVRAEVLAGLRQEMKLKKERLLRKVEDAVKEADYAAGGGQSVKERAAALGEAFLDQALSPLNVGGVVTVAKKTAGAARDTFKELTLEERGLLPSAVLAASFGSWEQMEAVGERGFGWSRQILGKLHDDLTKAFPRPSVGEEP